MGGLLEVEVEEMGLITGGELYVYLKEKEREGVG